VRILTFNPFFWMAVLNLSNPLKDVFAALIILEMLYVRYKQKYDDYGDEEKVSYRFV
jgi:hypothetical protein